jgi:hypothetical protein
MLNRTNLTLSALALSNRLNLGTRSLAANATAGVDHGFMNQSIRQAHHGFMRDGMKWCDAFPIPRTGSAHPYPLITRSFSSEPQCRSPRVAVQCSVCEADAQVVREPRPDNLVGRPERRDSDRDRDLLMTQAVTQTRMKTAIAIHLPLDARLRSKSSRLSSSKRIVPRAAGPLVALAAATTGK